MLNFQTLLMIDDDDDDDNSNIKEREKNSNSFNNKLIATDLPEIGGKSPYPPPLKVTS